MALIKLAAVGAAAYGLYRVITRRNEETTLQTAGAPRLGTDLGGLATSPSTPAGSGVRYVPPS